MFGQLLERVSGVIGSRGVMLVWCEDEECLAKQVLNSEVEGNRGRPNLNWMDGVRRTLKRKGEMSVKQGKQCFG